MKRAFGFAVQKRSGLLKQINKALDILDKKGVLDQLFDKWWLKRSACNGVHSSKIYSLNGSGLSAANTHYSAAYSVLLTFFMLYYFFSCHKVYSPAKLYHTIFTKVNLHRHSHFCVILHINFFSSFNPIIFYFSPESFYVMLQT